MKISIIVPIHNSQMYLEKCLDSILKQTLKDIEIILIDDASTDKSRKIIKLYELAHPQIIKAFFLDSQRYAGGARNEGIKQAKGEYLIFVDSDDYIDETLCEKLYQKALDTDSDIIFCDMYVKKGNSPLKWLSHTYEEQMGILTDSKRTSLITNPGYFGGMLIRRQLILDSKISFPENIIYEDYCTRLLYILCANKVELVKEPLYTYEIYNQSSTHKRNSPSHFDCYVASEWLLGWKDRKNYTEVEKNQIKIGSIKLKLQTISRLIDFFDEIPWYDIYLIAKNIQKLLKEIPDEDIFYIWGFVKEMKIVNESQLGFEEFVNRVPRMIESTIQQYELLYHKFYPQIMHHLEFWKREGKCVMIWGAGEKGNVMLKVFDAERKYIYGVLDQNSEKWGQVLATGHYVLNYIEITDKIDVLIIMNKYYDSQIKRQLEEVNDRVEIFNLEVELSMMGGDFV